MTQRRLSHRTVALVAVVAAVTAISALAHAQLRRIEEPQRALEDPNSLADDAYGRILGTVEACMQAEGFDYIVEPVPALEAAPSSDGGYGFAAPSAAGVVFDPNVIVVEALPPEERERYETALYGSPLDADDQDVGVGGCAAQAEAEWERTVNELLALDAALGRLQADVEAMPAYRAAVAEWSECMLGSGFDFATPADAEEAAREAFEDAVDAENETEYRAVIAAERQQAAADFECRAGTVDAVFTDLAVQSLTPGFVAELLEDRVE